MDDLTQLEERISKIESSLETIDERNQRVELEKSWEQSNTRVFSIFFLTYLLMCLVFYVLGISEFYLSAIIPSLGYLLSTLSLPIIKRLWIKQRSNQNQ